MTYLGNFFIGCSLCHIQNLSCFRGKHTSWADNHIFSPTYRVTFSLGSSTTPKGNKSAMLITYELEPYYMLLQMLEKRLERWQRALEQLFGTWQEFGNKFTPSKRFTTSTFDWMMRENIVHVSQTPLVPPNFEELLSKEALAITAQLEIEVRYDYGY